MKNKISLIVLGFIAAFLFASTLYFEQWKTSGVIAGGDPNGYYSYLPSVFIYHDLNNLKQTVTARYYENYDQHFDTTQQGNISECSFPKDGKTPVIKYTYGISVLQFPFFCAAHLLAKPFNFAANGYSRIYIVALQFSLVFYMLFGLWWLRKILRLYFDEFPTALALIAISLASNAYFFTTKSAPMSHIYLFSLYCLMLYAVAFFYKTFKWIPFLTFSFCCGLITAIRPNEITCVLIPIFYGIINVQSLKERAKLFSDILSKIVVGACVFFLPIFPVLYYWKVMAGKWIYDSYPNEHFDFLHPHIINGLFSFNNGWLAYSPVMYLAIIGMAFLYLKRKEWVTPIVLFIPIHIYTIYSWWCWNYINGFGSRPMVETYALWAIPMGAFFQYTLKKYLNLLSSALLLFFIALNIFQTWQVQNNLLISEMSNFIFIKNALFKTTLTQKDLVELDISKEQPTDLKKQREVFRQDFEDSTNSHYIRSIAKPGNFSYYSTGDPMYLIDYHKTASEAGLKKSDWIKASIWCKPINGCDIYNCSSLIVEIKHEERIKQYLGMRLQNKVLIRKTVHPYNPIGEGVASFFVPMPKNLEPDDQIKVYMVATSVPLIIDDVVVEIWN